MPPLASPRFARPLLALALALAAFASPALAQRATYSQDGLEDHLDNLIGQSDIDGARWGVMVVDLESGQTLFRQNEADLFTPASNTKLVTTAAALDLLGPDFRYETSLWIEGAVVGGTLWGNLIVRGAGDPTLGARFEGVDRRRVFRAWADSLRAHGILRVAGDIVGDDDVFDDELHGYGWEEEDFLWGYGAEISGLSFHEGTVAMRVEPTRPGQRARVTWEPGRTDYVTITNLSTTRPAGGGIAETYERPHTSNVITVAAEVAVDTVEEEALAVHNPTGYFVHVLQQTLAENGVEVRGVALDVDEWDRRPDYGRMERVAAHESVPLRDIVEVTNTESHNLFAEHLLRSLGALRYAGTAARPGSAESGVLALAPFLEAAEIEPSDVQLFDGSGLSPFNRITPRALVRLLRYMDAHPIPAMRRAFRESLALGGRTGTLERRFRSGPALDNVRAKTGFIRSVRTLSGYVTSASGRRLAFSILCNGFEGSASRATAVQDDLVEAMALYQGR